MPYEKVGKNDPVCIADEVPFEIPESWEWVKLKDIVIKEVKRGKSPTYANSGNVLVFAQKCNTKAGNIDLSLAKHLDLKVFTKYPDEEYMQNNDIVVNSTGNGTLGRIGVFRGSDRINDCIIVPDSHVTTIRVNAALISDYIYYALTYYQPYLEKNCSGSTNQTELKPAVIANLFIPVPPYAEQSRIVKKLSEVLPLVMVYNDKETALETYNNDFPSQLKKSILQYAVQGKLVPQDPTDESASALLERIRAEKEQLIKSGKIKRDKHESVIFRRDNSYYERVDGIERCIDDEIPFEIPDSWEWVRLKNIVNVVSARRVHQSDWKESGVPFYRAREIAKLADDGYVDNELFISENLYNEFSKSGAPQSGDLMVTAVGTLGKVYIVQQTDKFYYKDASVICFMNFGKLNPEYLKLIMMSPFMVSAIKDHSTGTTVGTITLVTANEYLVPVPPFLEQTRIVAHFQKLNHLINACNM